jgi:hypothetical protein
VYNNIQRLKFDSPELKRLAEVWRENNPNFASYGEEKENTWTARAVTLWTEEKMMEERRHIARDNGYLFDDPSGLTCDRDVFHTPEMVAIVKEQPCEGSDKKYTQFFCRRCAQMKCGSHLEFCIRQEDEISKREAAELKDLLYRIKGKNSTIRDPYDSLDNKRVKIEGYNCPTCGIVSGEPYKSYKNYKRVDKHVIYEKPVDKCVICHEVTWEYFKEGDEK